ncbi:MAG: bifunctional adenosylcobinamide kinase/adenosylcobinamide-phosphate guanylyltransferase [Nitrospinae bacterium]|nr:bifunctional adenosylcobinamide kinase/adenosylcobinamide-phosphate guanylyltransferase [Nitrospinota bacterium]MBF0634649.1 bifunctional adenosylcobinamide kinase/adenosylcobinamide-phosphate guanylyltransferase [Nitrospinota bacterium]
MGQLILVTGGQRSGKSAFALKVAQGVSTSRYFIATAEAGDGEMEERIEKHRKEREQSGWTTIEEQLDIPSALRSVPEGSVAIVDCLTLWVNNLMMNGVLTESEAADRARLALKAARESGASFVFVTSEVGMGVVPMSKEGRLYCDLLGRVNQRVAMESDHVYLLVSGLPLALKGGLESGSY